MPNPLFKRPEGPAEYVADAVRAVAAASVIVAAVGWSLVDALSILLVLALMFVPRALGLRPGFDITFGIVVLVAVWSNVLDLYLTARWWDLPVHFATNGVCAALVYVVLTRFEILADPATLPRPRLSVALVTTFIGVTFGVLWELWEWFAYNFLDPRMLVGYEDSLGDLVVGGLGSLVAGLAMRSLMAPRSASREQASHTR
ncbi:hypothetical protein [Agromyces sp. Marseille-P2726]|uniref:hypothetical protein n=1 Tax=Agromyces sp. Marseille-P2726 TaxID=2709132 RepID=UPI00156E2419|nr:hypothetical protein [Agromyces sp. Marseille-P2726]